MSARGRVQVLAAVVATGWSFAAQSATVVAQWNAAALQEVRLGRLGPPIVARALAVAHTCMYDAWAAYDTRALPVSSTVPRRPSAEATAANKNKAISFAAYRCLVNLFPSGSTRLASTMASLGYDPADASTSLTTAQGIGNAAAAAVIEARRNDNSNQYGTLAAGAYADWTGYVPRNPPAPFCDPLTVAACPPNTTDLLHWQPLINNVGATQAFIAPHWNQVKPFALSSAAQFDNRNDVAAGPNYLRNYTADVDQMVAISGALTPQQKLIVEYWADGPASELPPGHWGLFAQHVSQRDGHSIDQDVKMFFAMHNASFDAGIVAWHLKRQWDGVRPITAVRGLKQGQSIFAWGGPGQPNTWIPGEKWSPYNPGSNLTPAFPGWISGHSTFSAASAQALRSFKGNDTLGYSTTLPAGFGRVEPNVPEAPTTISYPTFTAAVSDAGMSRLYGGIHFADDNTLGQTLGGLIGQQAWTKALYLFEGGLVADGGSLGTPGWSRSLSWSHTVPANSNRLLIVGVHTDADSPATSVTYAGKALQKLGSARSTVYDHLVQLWYLVAPPVGTATLSVVKNSGSDLVAGAINAHGIDAAAPFGTLRSALGSTASACVTLANEPVDLVVTVMSASADAGSVNSGTGLTRQYRGLAAGGNVLPDDPYGIGSTGPAVPGGSVCHTLGKAKAWVGLAVPLRPAASR